MARSSLKNVMRLIDVANSSLSTEESFLNDLKRSIEMTADTGAKLPSKTYKPSGMNCIRASYYQIMGIQPDEARSSYSLVGICNSGTDIHVRVQTAVEQMKDNDMDCEYIDVAEFVNSRQLDDLTIVSKNGMETKLYHKKFNMSFMCDGIIRYKGHYYILELKTESSFKFMNRKDVDPSHYNQGTAYSLAFGIDQVLFVYINRDVFEMKAFMFNVTNVMKEALVGYIEECDGYVKRMITPPKPVDVNKKACSYCMYKAQCRKDG
jgi:CRISPR/Cas system-associated exonuclease Cas4 (RecB family)